MATNEDFGAADWQAIEAGPFMAGLAIAYADLSNKVAIAVGHERRFEPPIIDLMRTVRSGELGVPLQIEANFSQDKFLTLPADNWRLTPEEAPAGPMTATGIHILDLCVGIFGEAESVLCSVRQLGSQLTNGDTLAARHHPTPGKME